MSQPRDRGTQRTRIIALEGGRNFRDLGGYATSEGRRVRWGRVYRSGVLAYLTDAGRAQLDDLGVRVVCDLRTAYEQRREPVRWRRDNLEHLAWDYDARLMSLRGIVGFEELTPESVRAGMMRLYRALPTHLATPYAAVFARLAAGDLPLVFGCAAGKDRTGVIAGVLLTTLGVPRETVLEDFELTDRAVDLEQALVQLPEGSLGLRAERTSLGSLARETRAPVLRADPAYLEAAFDAIESAHGSIAGYLRECLGLSDAQLGQLRDQLLED